MPEHLIHIKGQTNWCQRAFNMKYLITGATGQLGREWVEFLQSHEIAFEAYGSSELDITDINSVRAKIESGKPDVVINCAAYTNVDEAEDQTAKAFEVNAQGVINLIDACSRSGSKLVHYSTDYVFPGIRDDEKKYAQGYPEDAPKNPINAYGRSKRDGEVALEKSNIDYLLIRVSWLCGAYGGNFVKTMLRLSKERNELSVVDDQIGCPTYTFDVVDKSFRLLEKGASGVYHVSSRGKITWADFANEVFSLANRKVILNRVTSAEYPTKAKRPAFSLLSTQKLEQEGLKPIEWEAGLSVLIDKLNSDL